MLNAFTVDVEDYFQVSSFDRAISREHWNHFESRVVRNTHRVLELLDRHDVQGTFFVLGWIADRYPKLVRDIQAAGHELACHSYWHDLVYQQTPKKFRSDLRRAKSAIEDAAGARVVAYRAPSFSITRASLWALDVLVQEGFEIDSSIFPTRHDRYGIPGAEARLHRIETPAGSLWEFPQNSARFGPVSLPVSGGGYFRLYPFKFTQFCLRALNRGGRPFSFYVHPWEIDPEQPRIHNASRLSRFRHYVNLSSTEGKLDRLLSTFRFGSMSDVIAEQQSLVSIPSKSVAAVAIAATGG